ncbi:hypothetical protein [Kribbella sp. NPDC051770]|uniref:hypothetical protein n=1 Tax=Kribbella sp. NPDC051770 TaxID=3155413 RepID=UPI003416638E
MRKLRPAIALLAVLGASLIALPGSVLPAGADRDHLRCGNLLPPTSVETSYRFSITEGGNNPPKYLGGVAPVTELVTQTQTFTETTQVTVDGGLSAAKFVEVSGSFNKNVSMSETRTFSDTVTSPANGHVFVGGVVVWRHATIKTVWYGVQPDQSLERCIEQDTQGMQPWASGICTYTNSVRECPIGKGSGGASGPPGGGVSPPTGPQPVTSVHGLADGTVLSTTDTKRIYKMVGGAPIWQSTCDGGICQPQPRPTTQAVINAGPATPRNASTAVDQVGSKYIFVGGAPIKQDSCAAPVNCGNPVKISTWSIEARDHMNRKPADMNLVQARSNGTDLPVSMTVGGALIPLSSPQEAIDAGFGTDWASKVVIISGLSYHLIGFEPRDGTLVQGSNGSTPVAALAGNAVIPFANPQEVVDAGHGTDWPGKVRSIPARAFNLFPKTPVSSTLIQGSNGSTPVATMVGDARINFANPQELIDAGYGTDWASKVNSIPARAFNAITADVPADGTLIQGTNGSSPVAVMVGGARVPFANPQELIDSGYGAKWSEHVRAIPGRAFNLIPTVPADGTLVVGRSGGQATPVSQMVGGAPVPFWSPQAVVDSGFGADWDRQVRSMPTREYNLLPKVPRDGTVVLSDNGIAYKVVGGGVEVLAGCPEWTGCASGTLARVPQSSMADLMEYKPTGLAWTDFTGDGKADYCRRVGEVNQQSSRLSCTPSTGTGYGTSVVSNVVDWGYPTGRQWVDFNGDKKADYCRIGGTDNRKNARAFCTLSTGDGFSGQPMSGVIDAGEPVGRTWVDVTGDGKADYCRVRGDTNHTNAFVSCAPSTGAGFGADVNSGNLDWGFHAGRAFTDFDGDGKADYCRIVGTANHTAAYASCTVSTGTGFGTTYRSAPLDWGFGADRVWADVNGDQKSDFCRRVGSPTNSHVSCTLSTGTGFGATISAPVDWGKTGTRAWVDATGDGKADFCRIVGTANHTDARITCTPSTGTGFGAAISSGNTDWGTPSGRAWADFNADGKADFCRRVGSDKLYCTTSTGQSFTGNHLSAAVDWGHLN